MSTVDTIQEDNASAVEVDARPPSDMDAGVQAEKVFETVDRLLVRMVPLAEIAFARRAKDLKDQVGFFNPRQDTGFEQWSMEELENSIAQDGLLEFPNVRLLDKGGYQLIAGERRIRAISNLVSRNDQVYDEATDRRLPAKVLYANVPCRVVKNANDMKALRIALHENGQHQRVSERDLVDLCEWMLDRDVENEERKMSRKEVCKELGMSESWLCQTLSFKTKLDMATLDQLFTGRISRSYAIDLMAYDEADRTVVNEAAQKVAQKRFDTTLERAEAEQAEAEVAVEDAQEKVITAPNNKKERTAKAKVSKAKDKLEQAAEKVKQIEDQGAQPQQGDLATGAIDLGIQPLGVKGLSSKQLHERWIDRLNDALSKDKVRQKETGRIYPRRDILLVRCVAQAIAHGGYEPLLALDDFYRQQGGWGIFGADGFNGKLETAAKKFQAVDEVDDLDDEDIDDIDLDEDEDEDLDDMSEIDDIDLDEDDEEDDDEDEETLDDDEDDDD